MKVNTKLIGQAGMNYVAFVLLLMGCAKMPVHESRSIAEADDLRYHSEKVKYDVFSDDKNMEIHMEVADRTTQVKILRFGFTVWVDKTGKKKVGNGVEFPISGSQKFDRSQMSRNGQRSGPNFESSEQLMKLHQQFKSKPQMMKVVGFGQEEAIYNLAYDQPEIMAKSDFDDDLVMNYTVTIPLDKIYDDPANGGEPVSLGLISGALEMPSMGGGPPRGMGGGPSGGRMGGGGRPGGGRPPGAGGGFNQQRMQQMIGLTEPLKIWFKVTVAKK